jgi:subtilisin family serine protease
MGWRYAVPSRKQHAQDAAFALEVKDAVEQGIFVIFSAGNGQFSVELQVPEVFAAGGVFMAPNTALQASDYASGYSSAFFPGRVVPDACGLVGLLPRAMYLMLPVPPGCELDRAMIQKDDEGNPGDGTAPNDGWGLFSGTSAAAPQVAGVAAVLLSANGFCGPRPLTQRRTSAGNATRSKSTCVPRVRQWLVISLIIIPFLDVGGFTFPQGPPNALPADLAHIKP